MTQWHHQMNTLIAPAVARSRATDEVVIGPGVLRELGQLAARVTQSRKALVMADTAGFGAAGSKTVSSLQAAGFAVDTLILPHDPLPMASIEEAEPFRTALASDPDLFPVSVGSGVINDLVKWSAFVTRRQYLTVATAASMDGYTSAGAPLAQGGFKVTISTQAPVAMLADLDVISAAPAEMNAWGYGDLAGKIPAGGDWLIADALDVEPVDDVAWPMVQDRLKVWLDRPEGIASGDMEGVARLFVGLTAVGFAMEAHGSSRPASGADHQIAHMWEMQGLTCNGKKVSHGAAVSVACVATLALYDWLIAQDFSALDVTGTVSAAPTLDERQAALTSAIADTRIAEKAQVELAAKHAGRDEHTARLEMLKSTWPQLRRRLASHLVRHKAMAGKLGVAGAPAFAHQIGVSDDHLLGTLRAAAFIRRRYTIFDLLHETGLTKSAFASVLPGLVPPNSEPLK